MPRSSSSLLFAVVLLLSFALLCWWTTFLLLASGDVATAGEHLANGDVSGAAVALGADEVADLSTLARRRQWMFASEGVFFAVVLAICGLLYRASVRRENDLRRHRDRFLAAATHELKTPLATISLLLESLRDGRVPEAKLDRYLRDGLVEAERLEHGLHNVLTAAGLRSTGSTLHRELGDLAEDVQQAIEALQERAQAAGVRIAFAPAARPTALRDATAWQLVLRNLLDNAIKFSPADRSVTIELDNDDNTARLAITDQGRGLDARELAHAFEPFFRGDDRASGGTGLGLHLVDELVRAHGGDVSVRSDGRNRGSVVVVRLPLQESA